VVAVGALAVAGVVRGLEGTTPLVEPRQECTAELDGAAWTLSPEQAENAALVAAVPVVRGMPARAATIGIATALQESRLVNIDYGDRDSVGLFQQRTSQGWGTVEQIMDPVYSTNAFYDGLATVDGYESMAVTEAAQAVQRSGFPDAYAQHETRSRAGASALAGHSPASRWCALRAPEAVDLTDVPPTAAALDVVRLRLARDLGPLPVTPDPAAAGSVVVDASGLGPADDPTRLAWAVAHWAVATASTTGVTSVTVADAVWTRDSAGWDPLPEPLPAGAVRLAVG